MGESLLYWGKLGRILFKIMDYFLWEIYFLRGGGLKRIFGDMGGYFWAEKLRGFRGGGIGVIVMGDFLIEMLKSIYKQKWFFVNFH